MKKSILSLFTFASCQSFAQVYQYNCIGASYSNSGAAISTCTGRASFTKSDLQTLDAQDKAIHLFKSQDCHGDVGIINESYLVIKKNFAGAVSLGISSKVYDKFGNSYILLAEEESSGAALGSNIVINKIDKLKGTGLSVACKFVLN